MANTQVVAIDLGSFHTRVMVGKKLLFDEKTCLAYDHRLDRVLAVGDKAFDLFGKTPGSIEVVFPMQRDQIQKASLLKLFLKELSKKFDTDFSGRFEYRVAIPLSLSKTHRDILTEMCQAVGADKVILIERSQAIVTSLLQQKKISDVACVIVMGEGSTDVVVYAGGEHIADSNLNSGGRNYIDVMTKILRQKYQVQVGLKDIYQLRDEIGSIQSSRKKASMVRGKNVISYLPETVTLNSSDFTQNFQKQTQRVINQVTHVFASLTPEIVKKIMENGVILAGSGSNIVGVDAVIEESLGCRVERLPAVEYEIVKGLTYET